MFFLNLFNIEDRQTTTIHENKPQRSMPICIWNRQEFVVGVLSTNLCQCFGKFLVVHLHWVRKSWGMYLLITLIDDDPAKSLS